MDALSPGTLLGGRYRLVDELGRGGMARVWRAVDEVLGRLVAVKVLAPGLRGDRDFLDRFRTEARAAALLAHPQIAGVFDYGEWDLPGGERVACIVLELLEGESLAARLRRGPLPWPEAVAVAAQVAQALAAAHRRGLVHRDVKPGNVVLTPDGAKVLDFGIAAMAGVPEGTPAGALLGTAAYLAPELRAGSAPTPAVDVYALGVLLFEAIAGRLPEPAAAMSLSSVAGLPGEVVALQRRCVAWRAEERPSSARVAELLAAAAGLAAGRGADGRAASGRAPGDKDSAASSGRAAGDTALLLEPGGQDHGPARALGRGSPAPWLVGAAMGAVMGLAVVLVLALWPAPRQPAPQPPAPTTTRATALTTSGAATPAGSAAAVASLERVQRSVDDGVAAGQIRPDVGTDLDNLLGNLRAALASRRPGNLVAQVGQLQDKLRQRLTEPGAIAPARALAVSAALTRLARSLPPQ
jgi:eukaryotic-like serine/threonine-protein kinase